MLMDEFCCPLPAVVLQVLPTPGVFNLELVSVPASSLAHICICVLAWGSGDSNLADSEQKGLQIVPVKWDAGKRVAEPGNEGS